MCTLGEGGDAGCVQSGTLPRPEHVRFSLCPFLLDESVSLCLKLVCLCDCVFASATMCFCGYLPSHWVLSNGVLVGLICGGHSEVRGSRAEVNGGGASCCLRRAEFGSILSCKQKLKILLNLSKEGV